MYKALAHQRAYTEAAYAEIIKNNYQFLYSETYINRSGLNVR